MPKYIRRISWRCPGLNASILSVGAFVPPGIMTNFDLPATLDTNDEWIRTRTGIRQRHVAGPEETTASISAIAAERALKALAMDPREVDWMLLCTDTPEMWSPATACFVQDAIGARYASAIDLTGGCAGFLQTLEIADKMAQAGATVLVIGTEVLTKALDWTDRATAVLFGDGSGAVVVAPSEDGIRIRHARSQSDGSQADILGKPYGGTRNAITPQLVAEGHLHAIRMEGQRVFKRAVQDMGSLGVRVLQEMGLTTSQIDWVIPHQANQRIIDAVAHHAGIDLKRVFSHVADYANTGSASIVLALADMLNQSLIKKGQNLLTVAFGSGFSWASQLWDVATVPPVSFE